MRTIVAAGVVVAVVVGAAVFVLTRPVVETASAQDSDVTIECRAATDSEDVCRSSGDRLLASEPPSTTFEMEDLARLTITRGMFGLAPTCEAAYYLQRYPDDPAWRENTECPTP
jgi:hypothetical protein